jgi:hypothetical protein
MKCVVYMGVTDVARQAQNVYRMKLLGAEVVPVESGSKTLKDALNEAMRDWVTNVEDTYYLIGTAAGPHPYPAMVRDFQSVIGKETKVQMQARRGKLPDAVVAAHQVQAEVDAGGGAGRGEHVALVDARFLQHGRGTVDNRARGVCGAQRDDERRRGEPAPGLPARTQPAPDMVEQHIGVGGHQLLDRPLGRLGRRRSARRRTAAGREHRAGREHGQQAAWASDGSGLAGFRIRVRVVRRAAGIAFVHGPLRSCVRESTDPPRCTRDRGSASL